MSSAYLRAALFAVLLAPSGLPGAKADLDFTRDARPILPEERFRCHGPYQKARTSGLRLDEYAGAVEEREGERAIAPRAPAATELIAPTKTDDPARRMPLGGDRLPEEEIKLLDMWICGRQVRVPLSLRAARTSATASGF